MKKTTRLLGATGAVLALAAAGLPAATASGGPRHHDHDHGTLVPVAELQGPRGVDALGHGRTLVTESDGTFSLVVQHRHAPATVHVLGQLPTDFAPAIALGRHRTVYLLTGAAAGPPEQAMQKLAGRDEAPVPAAGATLYRWRPGWDAPQAFADIGAYQATDPDPYDLEDNPTDSNPFGLAALRDGSVLVSDAAGNDLLHVDKHGDITTVARLAPRTVAVPEGLPELPPEEGGPFPPAGTMIPSEAVATSVTVGRDGAWYVGELRGFPATPGTSQIWRIEPGTVGATCDPEHPWAGPCKRYADGLTSIVDLAPARHGILAVELSKASWLAVELGLPGSETGALYLVRGRHDGDRHHAAARHGSRLVELVPDQLVTPGGADTADGDVYVVGPVFGPGGLFEIR